jgi:hypothetical protein
VGLFTQPQVSGVPECAITPCLARHRTKPMVEDRKVPRELGHDGYRVGRKASHNLRALLWRWDYALPAVSHHKVECPPACSLFCDHLQRRSRTSLTRR